MANAAINEGVPGDYCSALCGRLKIMLRMVVTTCLWIKTGKKRIILIMGEGGVVCVCVGGTSKEY